VRAIGQFLPGRPVTGLDIGCGTGRYTRLLRALLPGGSRLAAADVSPAMLAQLKAASQRHAEQLPLRAASLDVVTAFNSVHHFDLGRFLAAAARVLAPGGQLFIYTRTPQQNARTIWGRYFPGFTAHEQRLHSQAALRDAVRRTGGLQVVATQTFQHPRTSTAGRLRAQAEGATTRPSPSTPPKSCARPSRPSWPACPAPRSAGLTNTSWSSSAGVATRWSRTARAAGRAGRSRVRPPSSAPGAPPRLPQDVLAAPHRSPGSAPFTAGAVTPQSACIAAVLRASAAGVSTTFCNRAGLRCAGASTAESARDAA
jgi:Methyltransferase domain